MKRQHIRKLLLLISFLCFPVTLFYFSPYLIIQGGAAGIFAGSAIIFLAMFLFSLVVQRAFCGWLCPAGGLQEICSLVNDKQIKSKKINIVKYFIWVPWLAGVVLSFVSAGGIKKADFFFMTDHGISCASIPGFVIYYGIITLITVLALILGRRGMCHSVCWMAPFMILGTKLSKLLHLPSLHLKPAADSCINCRQCSKKCPMSLNVADMVLKNDMTNSECILCGECVDTCPKKAIRFTVSR